MDHFMTQSMKVKKIKKKDNHDMPIIQLNHFITQSMKKEEIKTEDNHDMPSIQFNHFITQSMKKEEIKTEDNHDMSSIQLNHFITQSMKKEEIKTEDNHDILNIQLDAPFNNQIQILPPSQIISSFPEQQFFIHSNAQDLNQLFQYDLQNNQQLQLLSLPVSAPAQAQLIQLSNGQSFIYQPKNVVQTQVIAQPQQPQPMLININGRIMQLDSTVCSISPTLVAQSVTSTTVGQAVPQQNSLMTFVKSEPLEEPLYVNEKQYHRILIRRQARAKLEAEGKIPKERRKYMHESRHKHASNRTRGIDGRFNSKTSKKTKTSTTEVKQKQQ